MEERSHGKRCRCHEAGFYNRICMTIGFKRFL
jgi:hypothetical protein